MVSRTARLSTYPTVCWEWLPVEIGHLERILSVCKCKCKCKCNLFTHGAPRSSKNSFKNARAFQDRIGIWKCWFLRRGENRSTRRKTSRSRVENQQQTQPTYDAGSGNRTRDTLVGGERSHHYTNPVSSVLGQLG